MRAGWRVIAAKEFTDEITSLRFLMLTIVLTSPVLPRSTPRPAASSDVASDVSGQPSLFLVLFTGQVGQIPPFTTFITFLGPLLGIAFGFDCDQRRARRRARCRACWPSRSTATT